MKTYLDLSPVPVSEDCEQLGPNYDPDKAMAECRRMKELLLKKFPLVGNTSIGIKSNPHDFGSYLSVIIRFDDEVEEEIDYAMMLESSLPEFWED